MSTDKQGDRQMTQTEKVAPRPNLADHYKPVGIQAVSAAAAAYNAGKKQNKPKPLPHGR